MTNLHKALEALTRLPQTEMRAVNELTAAVRAVAADALKTLQEQADLIDRLLADNARLLADLEDAEAGFCPMAEGDGPCGHPLVGGEE